MNPLDAKNMTPIQRVLAMETLWESMCQSETEMDSPEWHEEILEARRTKIADGSTGFISLKQLKKRLSR